MNNSEIKSSDQSSNPQTESASSETSSTISENAQDSSSQIHAASNLTVETVEDQTQTNFVAANQDSADDAAESDSTQEAEPEGSREADDQLEVEESTSLTQGENLPAEGKKSAKKKPRTEEVPATASEEPVIAGENAESKKHWYVIKVTSGQEDSIKARIERRIKIDGLEQYFGQLVIPVERVTEVKKVRETRNGEKTTREKRVVKEKKKFPGYLMAEVEYNNEILAVFRDTPGVGDFVGAGLHRKPTPMTDLEVQRMLGSLPEEDIIAGRRPKISKVKLDFEQGDQVRIREGAFASYEGEVTLITEPKDDTETPKVTVKVSILGRPVPVELDFWQVDKI